MGYREPTILKQGLRIGNIEIKQNQGRGLFLCQCVECEAEFTKRSYQLRAFRTRNIENICKHLTKRF